VTRVEAGSEPGKASRRVGGLKAVREGVWRVDVELPRVEGGARRRVSRTVSGSREDAQAALEELSRQVSTEGEERPRARRSSGSSRAARPRSSGGITSLGPDRWLVGVEGERDPLSVATIYIDHPGGLCGACGRSGAVRSMAGQVGISELTVVWPGGSTVIVP